MSKMKNKKFFDIALAVGGSHYPGVGGDLLEKFGEMVVKECCQKLEDDGMVEVAIELKQHFGVK
jgi:hypothetical protein